MNILRIYILLTLVLGSSFAYSITLPSQSFFGANELYEENFDQIEYEFGTQIRGINLLIGAAIEEWGNACLDESLGEQGKCHKCCDTQWLDNGYEDQYEEKYYSCISICNGGPSLPLGSPLLLLPFVFAYAGIKRYRKAQI
jgi:hypothetical protein